MLTFVMLVIVLALYINFVSQRRRQHKHTKAVKKELQPDQKKRTLNTALIYRIYSVASYSLFILYYFLCILNTLRRAKSAIVVKR